METQKWAIEDAYRYEEDVDEDKEGASVAAFRVALEQRIEDVDSFLDEVPINCATSCRQIRYSRTTSSCLGRLR
jgi:hypothetical protein